MAFSVSLVRLHALLRNKASQTLAIYFAQFSLTRVRRYVHGKGKFLEGKVTNMFLSENEKARPKIILFCEMRAVIKRPKPYHLFYEGM